MTGEIESIDALKNWIGVGIAGFLLVAVIQNIASYYQEKTTRRIITGVAVANGLIIGTGLSPMSSIAAEIVPLTVLLTSSYVETISSLVKVGTVLEMSFGILQIYEGSGWSGVVAFFVAFLSGSLMAFPDSAPLGFLLTVMAILWIEGASGRRF